jgi:hypothetical protein
MLGAFETDRPCGVMSAFRGTVVLRLLAAVAIWLFSATIDDHARDIRWLPIWLALRFAMLGPCRRVVLVRLASLFGLIVPIGHVIGPRLMVAFARTA